MSTPTPTGGGLGGVILRFVLRGREVAQRFQQVLAVLPQQRRPQARRRGGHGPTVNSQLEGTAGGTSGADQQKLVANLSGVERNRLLLSRHMTT